MKQIAADLGISDGTAHTHRLRGMQKLGVGSVTELIDLLRMAGDESGPGG